MSYSDRVVAFKAFSNPMQLTETVWMVLHYHPEMGQQSFSELSSISFNLTPKIDSWRFR